MAPWCTATTTCSVESPPTTAGVRYPAQLLDEVQAMLLSQQELQKLQLAASGSGLLLTTAAAPAAGGAAVVVVKEEPPTPVVPSLLKKAYRWAGSLRPYSVGLDKGPHNSAA